MPPSPERRAKTVPVSLRVKPGIEAHTHEYIMTGTDDSKFGLGIYDGEALDAVEEILRCPELSLIGLHSHIGSQIFELEPFVIATERLTDFIVTVRNRFGATLSEINFGGGFGISYTDEDAANPALRLCLGYESTISGSNALPKSCP